MQLYEFEDTVKMVTLECPCGVRYALTKEFITNRRQDHKTFYCPNGCATHYPQKSDKEKLQDEISKLEQRLSDERRCCISAREEANTLERKLWGMKGYAKRLKNQLQPELVE